MPYVEGQTVHDADAHVMELPGTIERYIDPKYREALAARLRKKGDTFGDEARALQADPEFRAGADEALLLRKNYQAMGAFDAADRPRAVDLLGFASQLIFSTAGLFLFSLEHGDDPDLAECARRLVATGCEYVLVTGTHENTVQVVNTLYGQEGVVRSDAWQRLPGTYHGSGCTLASAIAATIANGLSVPEAVKDAQEYTWQTLRAAFRPGMGQHIPDRLFWAREEEAPDDNGRDQADDPA